MRIADWTVSRADWRYRTKGNRDWYLAHDNGASACIFPVKASDFTARHGIPSGGYIAQIAGSATNWRGFPTRREAFAWAAKNALAAYDEQSLTFDAMEMAA